MQCPSCRHDNPETAKFCNECGTRLTESGQPGVGLTSAGDSLVGGDVVGRDKVAQSTDSSAQAAGGAAATTGAVAVDGDVGGNIVIAKDGAQVFIGEQPVKMTAVQRESALGRFLHHVISRTRYLQLQGIRSGGKLVNIELESIYITLKAIRTRSLEAEEAWLAEERRLAPGEGLKLGREPRGETLTVKVEEALAEHRHLVVLGDPGSGKTTLLRFLALLYARDRAEGTAVVRERLGLNESEHVPILLPLRNLGAFLKARYPAEDGTEGHGRLLEFLRAYLKGERLDLPEDFFDAYLAAGRAVLLLDGMDEVGDFDLRRRVARLVEAFAAAYPVCRLVVTSRVVGYTGAARLGEGFTTTTVRDFTLADVEQFLSQWHRLVAIGQMAPGESAEAYAQSQTEQLMAAIKGNERVRELAINPLMLTVIALVHRDRVKLPDRRAELYAEAVDVLLGKWDEARGVEEIHILDDRPFDTGDRRLLLQAIALRMLEAGQKEIEAGELVKQVREAFARVVPNPRAAVRATERFINVIQERTGLLVEAGPGAYRFSHLTFQEYLAAVEAAEREDFPDGVLRHSGDPFWRETILLVAGYLSTKHRAKTTRLIRAIADYPDEPEPFHNLVLAAECIRDVGPARLEQDVQAELRQRLKTESDRPVPETPANNISRWLDRMAGTAERRKLIVRRRIAAGEALARIESGGFAAGSRYWNLPHGEPDWVAIPAGEFWMGSAEDDPDALSWEKPLHRVYLPEYRIARVPVTNAQYQLYVQATSVPPPPLWEDGQPPKAGLTHPVVGVSWHQARQYCEWLSSVTGRPIRLPSEAEWERAARGAEDKRRYPWGDRFDAARCNTRELGLEDTTPVGVFPSGASPYGVLDLSGNVWEWTRSLWGKDLEKPDHKYPYDPSDEKREDLTAADDVLRVLRGGSFYGDRGGAHCAARGRSGPGNRFDFIGFRCVVSSFRP